jgi:uncharacterized membrane protein
MYNDLILGQLSALREEAAEEYVQHLITEIEELDTLLDPEAQSLVENLRQYPVSDNVYEEIDENASLSDRLSDRLANIAVAGDSSPALVFMGLWTGLEYYGRTRVYTYPFILLNLGLSTLAALQAPAISMSQNRQAEKDRAVARNDYR